MIPEMILTSQQRICSIIYFSHLDVLDYQKVLLPGYMTSSSPEVASIYRGELQDSPVAFYIHRKEKFLNVTYRFSASWGLVRLKRFCTGPWFSALKYRRFLILNISE